MEEDVLDPAWIGSVVVVAPAAQDSQRTIPREVIGDAHIPAPPSADAQEILYFAPHGDAASPLSLFFETVAEDLPVRFAETVESIYVLDGREGWKNLSTDLRGASVDVAFPLTRPAPVQGEDFYLGPAESPKRDALLRLFTPSVQAAVISIDAAVAATAPAATTYAQQLLVRHRDAVVSEAFRYLVLGAGADGGSAEVRAAAVARNLRSSPDGVTVWGKDAASLVGALRAVRAPRDKLLRISAAADARETERRAYMARLVMPQRQLNPLTALPPPPDNEQQRSEAAERVALAAEIEAVCAVHPIVHRLWASAAVDLVALQQARTGRTSDASLASVLSMNFDYRRLVGGALKETLDACGKVGAELRADADAVWAYSRAVHGALEAQGVAPGTLSFAAADEKIEIVGAGSKSLRALNDVVTAAQLLAVTGMVTAPAAGVLEVVSLAVSLMELKAEVWKVWHESRASHTHLNPALSLSAEPSYGMALLAILNVAANAHGVKGAAAKLSALKR